MIRVCPFFIEEIDNSRCKGIYCRSNSTERVNDFRMGEHSRNNHIIYFCECEYWDCEVYKILDGSDEIAKQRNY